jgi:hypothetical protein
VDDRLWSGEYKSFIEYRKDLFKDKNELEKIKEKEGAVSLFNEYGENAVKE